MGLIRLVGALRAHAMLRIYGDRASLLAALTAHWADQQLQLPAPRQPVEQPIHLGVAGGRVQPGGQHARQL